MHKRTLAAAAACAVTCAIAGSAPFAQGHANGRAGAAAIRQALQAGGLHAAAVAAGGEYRFKDPARVDRPPSDLKALVAASGAILIAEALERESHATVDDRAIATDYRMQVIESLRGPDRPGDVVVLRTRGGRVQYRDGTSARMDAPGVPEIRNGNRLVLFLTRVLLAEISAPASNWTSGARVYTPAIGAAALMTSAPDGTIGFFGRRDPVALAYRTRTAKQFMQDVKALVQ